MSDRTDSIYEQHLEDVAEILGTNPTLRSLAETLAWERRQRRRDLATIAMLERQLSPPIQEREENPFADTMVEVG